MYPSKEIDVFDRIPELLRRVRLDQNVTQEELAEISGVSVSQVSRIEAGSQDPQLDTVGRLLEAMGLDLDDFCRYYRDLVRELEPETPDSTREAGRQLAARLQPLLRGLPPGLCAAQLELPRHVIHIVPKVSGDSDS